jgi:hypothetical protein
MATWAANQPYVLLIIEEEAATAAIMATYSFVALVFPGAKRSRRVGHVAPVSGVSWHRFRRRPQPYSQTYRFMAPVLPAQTF